MPQNFATKILQKLTFYYFLILFKGSFEPYPIIPAKDDLDVRGLNIDAGVIIP
jgi:hypothetical protein